MVWVLSSFKASKLLLLDRDVFTLREFVTSALVILVDDPTGLLINHLLSQPVAGLGVDLVEMCFSAWVDAG